MCTTSVLMQSAQMSLSGKIMSGSGKLDSFQLNFYTCACICICICVCICVCVCVFDVWLCNHSMWCVWHAQVHVHVACAGARAC